MAAKNLHDNSPAAVATRRAYFASRQASGGASTAARRSSSRGSGVGDAASAGASHVARYARNPVRYTRDNSVGGAVLTFFAVMTLASLRRGSWPDQGQLMTIAAGTLVVVVSASLAPELVTHVLLVVLVIMVLTNASLVLKLIGFASGKASAVAA